MNNTITLVQPQKKDKTRLNVYIDNEFAFGVSSYIGGNLRVGQVLSQSDIDRIVNSDTREKAYQRALRFIGYKPRTEFEIRKKLKEIGFAESEIISVTEELSSKNYIDDRKYAIDWIELRSISKPRSRKQLAFELGKKGISREIIQEEIDRAPDDEDSALKLGRKMGVELPSDIHIVGIHTTNVYDFSEDLSPEVEASIPNAIKLVLELILKCTKEFQINNN